ncbi:hypothetical protein C7Y47_14680 [Lysinibacillus sphaericus]|uniref:Uncharacterized protein n=1 Tax=Lysinibacillus sphaericus TaxID=1421 RepID=A0A544UFB9_LYSSH|nr:hypothetical protein [Lysinibacillus sp. SDF0037]TQR31225.1 hypothetical protein C7Y47_14680 [Lysinibacillus sp. SDF0037]
MLGLFIGIVLIIIGFFIIPIGFVQLKDELGDYSDKPIYKRIFVYTIEIFSFLNLSNFIGWLLGIGFLLVISGFYFVILFFSKL